MNFLNIFLTQGSHVQVMINLIRRVNLNTIKKEDICFCRFKYVHISRQRNNQIWIYMLPRDCPLLVDKVERLTGRKTWQILNFSEYYNGRGKDNMHCTQQITININLMQNIWTQPTLILAVLKQKLNLLLDFCFLCQMVNIKLMSATDLWFMSRGKNNDGRQFTLC